MKTRTALRSALTVIAAVAATTGTPATAAPAPLPAPVTASPLTGQDLTPLVRLAAERVLLADRVAAAKYGTGTPIEDPAREQAVLDQVAERARVLGHDPDDAVRVFRDQIEANKLVQRALFAAWDAGVAQPPARRPTLEEIRPRIDSVNRHMLTELAATDAGRGGAGCGKRLIHAGRQVAGQMGLSPLHRVGLLRAVPSVCRAAADWGRNSIQPSAAATTWWSSTSSTTSCRSLPS